MRFLDQTVLSWAVLVRVDHAGLWCPENMDPGALSWIGMVHGETLSTCGTSWCLISRCQWSCVQTGTECSPLWCILLTAHLPAVFYWLSCDWLISWLYVPSIIFPIYFSCAAYMWSCTCFRLVRLSHIYCHLWNSIFLFKCSKQTVNALDLLIVKVWIPLWRLKATNHVIEAVQTLCAASMSWCVYIALISNSCTCSSRYSYVP